MKLKGVWGFLPFWVFLMLFKSGADLHFNSLSPLGERVFPVWVVGIIIGLFSLLQMVLDVPAGLLLDKFGYRRLLKFTTVVFIVATLLLFLFGLNMYTYIFTSFLSTIGWLFLGPGVNAYVISQASKKESNKFISFRDISGSIGSVVAGILFAVTISCPVQVMAFIATLFLVVSYVFIFLSPDDTENVCIEKKIPTQDFYIKRRFLHKVVKAIFKLNPVSSFLLISSLSSSIFYSIICFVIPLVIAHTESLGIMSWSLGVFDIAIIFAGFGLGKLAKLINRIFLIFLGLLVFGVMGTLLGFNFGVWFIVIGFIATVGDEIASLSLWSWLYDLDKDHAEDGLISGVLNLSHDLGWAIGPILGGFLYYGLGPSWTIMIGALFLLLAWFIYTIKLGALNMTINSNSNIAPKKPHKFRNGRY
ncbi:MAG: Major Facilitator Superfamily [Patescibacteria group bacterium]|nr:Major Facilitator Superfamily [Patescibacteria group bacterium]